MSSADRGTGFGEPLDTLPVRCRGWGIQNLRIWTAIIEEELERVAEAERQQAQAEVSAAPKSGSLAAPEGRTRGEGRQDLGEA